VELLRSDCWFDPRLVVGPSSIHGTGLFAGGPIPPGAVVCRLGGRLVSGQELGVLILQTAAPDDEGGEGDGAGDHTPAYVDSIAVGPDAHLVLPPGRLAHYGNHSCDPNLWWTGAYTLAARRPIAGGEELTNDYATSTGVDRFEMPCSCGASSCRGVVTGVDWRREDLQVRYGGHWVPVLLERIRDAGARSPEVPPTS
jgi:hypothetical protein